MTISSTLSIDVIHKKLEIPQHSPVKKKTSLSIFTGLNTSPTAIYSKFKSMSFETVPEQTKLLRSLIFSKKANLLADKLKELNFTIGAQLGSGMSGKVYRLLDQPYVLKIYKPLKRIGMSAYTQGKRGETAGFGIEGMVTAFEIYVYDPKTNKVKVVNTFSKMEDHFQHLAILLPLIDRAVELERLIHEKKILTMEQIQEFGKAFIKQLQILHDNGILHGDLKPSNILIDKNDKIRIADFGLARRLGGAKFLSSSGEGTIAYQAPEVKLGKYSKKSDLWSLGCILYKMATGRTPFGGDIWDTLEGESHKLVFPLSTPKHLACLIKDLLAEDPDKRPSLEACLKRLDQ